MYTEEAEGVQIELDGLRRERDAALEEVKRLKEWLLQAGMCKYDTNRDGDCHRCVGGGGCIEVGGPFKSVKEPDAEGGDAL